MVDEKGILMTTLIAIVGVAFAGIVGYQIIKKKQLFPRMKERCSKTVDVMKRGFQEGYRGVKNPRTA